MRRLIVGALVFAVGAAGCAATPEAVQTLTDTTAASATTTPTEPPATTVAESPATTDAKPPATTVAESPATTVAKAPVASDASGEAVDESTETDQEMGLAERVVAALEDRSFREFDPGKDAEKRKAVILTFLRWNRTLGAIRGGPTCARRMGDPRPLVPRRGPRRRLGGHAAIQRPPREANPSRGVRDVRRHPRRVDLGDERLRPGADRLQGERSLWRPAVAVPRLQLLDALRRGRVLRLAVRGDPCSSQIADALLCGRLLVAGGKARRLSLQRRSLPAAAPPEPGAGSWGVR